MTIRRILSVVLALVLSLAGFAALFAGGVARYRQITQYGPAGFDPAPVLLLVLGLLLLGAVAATILLSSAGAIVLGVIHIVWGLLEVLIPFDPLDGVVSPVVGFMNGLRPVWPDFSDGMFFFVPTGFGIAVGAILLTAGLLGRRPVPRGGLVRLVAVIAALVAAATGLTLVLAGGGLVYVRQLRFLTGEVEVVGVLVLLAGAVLLAAAAATVRWSALGSIVAGAALTVVGLVLVIEPFGVLIATRDVSRELTDGLQLAGPMGNVALVGVVLLGAGLGVALRLRRAVPVPPPGAAVYDG